MFYIGVMSLNKSGNCWNKNSLFDKKNNKSAYKSYALYTKKYSFLLPWFKPNYLILSRYLSKDPSNILMPIPYMSKRSVWMYNFLDLSIENVSIIVFFLQLLTKSVCY